MDENKRQAEESLLLARGVDSLYMYIEHGVNWQKLYERAKELADDGVMVFGGLHFVKVKAWIRTFPVCLRHAQFLFFVNRRAAYIKVLSLAFEMHGYDGVILWLCRILDRLRADDGYMSVPWLEYLLVSRVDVFVDFATDEEFKLDQFRTKLRKCGYFQSGVEAEGKTLYFGSRAYMMARLYVKSAEIKASGKTYLQSSWKCAGYDGKARVWRLEFEYHKDKIEEVCGYRQLVAVDECALGSLWSYGIATLEYVEKFWDNRNLSKVRLHPLWRILHEAMCNEYRIHPRAVRQANIAYRHKLARKWVISWLAAQGYSYDDLPLHYIQDFCITESDYQKAKLSLSLGAGDASELNRIVLSKSSDRR